VHRTLARGLRENSAAASPSALRATRTLSSQGIAPPTCLTAGTEMPTATTTCFHFACGFCGTLRLAHMLYSLARVSRRDR